MFSKVFDSKDLTYHLIFVKSCLTVNSCFYSQNYSKILQSLFHALPNNPIDKKHTSPKKKLGGKKKGGWGSRVSMTAVKDSMVFLGFPKLAASWLCKPPLYSTRGKRMLCSTHEPLWIGLDWIGLDYGSGKPV